MCFQRDTHIRIGCRQRNWLRVESLHRLQMLKHLYLKLLYRSLSHEASLNFAQLRYLRNAQASFFRVGALTRAHARCRLSGRRRQVSRNTQLARMHFRATAWVGYLPYFRHGRN